jgi:hypothetical protein
MVLYGSRARGDAWAPTEYVAKSAEAVFNQVTIHRGLTANHFDIGVLAETLLFYTDVLLLLDRGSLQLMLDALDQDTILRLLNEFGLKLSYHREGFATITNTTNGLSVHNLTDFKAGGQKGGKKIRSVHEEIENVIVRKLGSHRRARQFAKALIDRTSSHILKREDNIALIEAARADLRDASYTRDAANAAISILSPSITINPKWKFRIIDLEKEGFVIDTNMDFRLLNNAYKTVPGQEDGSLTESLITSYIFGARADAYFASSYMSGYVCDPLSSALVKRRFLDLIRRREREAAEIDLFQEKVLPQGRKVREVLNSGEASFADALSVIHEGQKFKKWLGAGNPDESLLNEYFNEIKNTSWLQKLPQKAYRFIITSGLGVAAAAFSPVVGTLAGLGLTAIDIFFVDRLLKGWRPDQFVDGSLTTFIEGQR